MTDKKNTITIDEASKAVAEALEKSGQALGGEIDTDEDEMFAEMMQQADAEAEDDSALFDDMMQDAETTSDNFLDELKSDEEVGAAKSRIWDGTIQTASMRLHSQMDDEEK